AVADFAWIDNPVAAHRARIGGDVAGARALVDAARVLALDRLQVLADDRVAEGPADRGGADAAADLLMRAGAAGQAREIRPARIDGGTGEASGRIALLAGFALSVAADGRGGRGGGRRAGGPGRAGGGGGDGGRGRATLAVIGPRAVVEAAYEGTTGAVGEGTGGATAAGHVAVADLLALADAVPARADAGGEGAYRDASGLDHAGDEVPEQLRGVPDAEHRARRAELAEDVRARRDGDGTLLAEGASTVDDANLLRADVVASR